MDILIPDKSLPEAVAAERVRCVKVALSAPMPMDGGSLYRMAWRDAAYAISDAIIQGIDPQIPPATSDAFAAFRAAHQPCKPDCED